MAKSSRSEKKVETTRSSAAAGAAGKGKAEAMKSGEETMPTPARFAEAKKLEKLDAKKPTREQEEKAKPLTRAPNPLRNSDFPKTYIKQISVSLDDPDHWMTLTWTGPKAGDQETGPFRTSPGAGMKGLNCDNVTTSRRSGSKCTPKGTLVVQGFQQRLNSDSRAVFVTWFQRARGIALHYFPSVPRYAASHGCVRVESKRVAQLIQDNSRINLTKVVVSGTWTKPAKQW